MPSPKSHSKEYGGSPPEAAALKDTVNGTVPCLGVAETVTTGGPTTRITTEAVPERRAVSVTVTVAANVPPLV